MEELRQILRTTLGKIISAIAAGAIAALAYVTELGTDWSQAVQEDLQNTEISDIGEQNDSQP